MAKIIKKNIQKIETVKIGENLIKKDNDIEILKNKMSEFDINDNNTDYLISLKNKIDSTSISNDSFHESDLFEYNMLKRTLNRNDDDLIIYINKYNKNYDKIYEVTKKPFDIFHKNEKIMDFNVLNNIMSLSWNFSKDIFILLNYIIIDGKSYHLEDITLSNCEINI